MARAGYLGPPTRTRGPRIPGPGFLEPRRPGPRLPDESGGLLGIGTPPGAGSGRPPPDRGSSADASPGSTFQPGHGPGTALFAAQQARLATLQGRGGNAAAGFLERRSPGTRNALLAAQRPVAPVDALINTLIAPGQTVGVPPLGPGLVPAVMPQDYVEPSWGPRRTGPLPPVSAGGALQAWPPPPASATSRTFMASPSGRSSPPRYPGSRVPGLSDDFAEKLRRRRRGARLV